MSKMNRVELFNRNPIPEKWAGAGWEFSAHADFNRHEVTIAAALVNPERRQYQAARTTIDIRDMTKPYRYKLALEIAIRSKCGPDAIRRMMPHLLKWANATSVPD